MNGYMRKAFELAKCPVALTGAGVSAPSGIPTFQSTWKERPVRDFLSRAYRNQDPIGFFELFCEMVSWCEAVPNEAHRALASMDMPVITQNIDGLHQRAGSKKIVELHGNLRTVFCVKCGRQQSAAGFCEKLRPLYTKNGNNEISADEIQKCLTCGCGGRFDTEIVLYGDQVQGLDEAFALLDDCDLLLVIGTSLETYPAAVMPQYAKRRGARVLIENQDCVFALTGKRGLS